MSKALTNFDVELIQYCRYRLGMSAEDIARDLMMMADTVRKYAPDLVEADGVREAYLESGMSASALARAMGWWSGRSADASRVRRMMAGEKMHYGTVLRFALALGVDPVDVGV